jgi:hypothetical protein
MPIAPQAASVTCPACGARFNAQVHRIIDVGRNPQYKQQLLSGQLNQAKCPHCGSGGMLSSPYLYHDPSKQLALVFLPTELNLAEYDQQRLIGALTNEAMMNLPPEQRKGYLFQPQIFLRTEGLIQRILEADGITEEVLGAQRARLELIEEFLATVDDEERFQSLVAKHKERLDYEFFHTLTASSDAARAEDQTQRAERLLQLRSILLDLSDLGIASRAQQEMVDILREGTTREELLEHIIAAKGEAELRGITSVARSSLDYQFFLMLSDRIDSASGDEAKGLRHLRDRLLTLTQELDQEAEAALGRSSEVLQAILESEDQEETVRARIGEIDDLVLALLSANMRQADTDQDPDRAGLLRNAWETIVGVLEEAMPPQIRLANRLLASGSEEERRELMREHSAVITPEFLQLMEAMAADLVERGQQEAGDRLRSIRGEVSGFLVSLDN